MDIEQLKIAFTTISVVIGLATLAKGVLEYTRKNRLDRAQIFLELRKKFKETENFSKIIAYLVVISLI